jgi:hypothetical protein
MNLDKLLILLFIVCYMLFIHLQEKLEMRNSSRKYSFNASASLTLVTSILKSLSIFGLNKKCRFTFNCVKIKSANKC